MIQSRRRFGIPFSRLGLLPMAALFVCAASASLGRPSAILPSSARPLVELSGPQSKITEKSYVLIHSQKEWDRLWEKDEKRQSQLVFIGKDLKEAKIRKELDGCLA